MQAYTKDIGVYFKTLLVALSIIGIVTIASKIPFYVGVKVHDYYLAKTCPELLSQIKILRTEKNVETLNKLSKEGTLDIRSIASCELKAAGPTEYCMFILIGIIALFILFLLYLGFRSKNIVCNAGLISGTIAGLFIFSLLANEYEHAVITSFDIFLLPYLLFLYIKFYDRLKLFSKHKLLLCAREACVIGCLSFLLLIASIFVSNAIVGIFSIHGIVNKFLISCLVALGMYIIGWRLQKAALTLSLFIAANLFIFFNIGRVFRLLTFSGLERAAFMFKNTHINILALVGALIAAYGLFHLKTMKK